MKPKAISSSLTIVIYLILFALFFTGHSEAAATFFIGVMLGMTKWAYHERVRRPQFIRRVIELTAEELKARGVP